MNKINRLMRKWPKGAIGLSSTLQNEGYQKDLLKKYVNGGWLDSLGYGAYKLADDEVDWFGGISALQKQKKTIFIPVAKLR